MLSVRELLADLEVELHAGEAGLDHPVRWVHITELVDPTPWLSGGEVLLTTGLQLTDPETQRAFVARLADHGLAGLGVGTGFVHRTVPRAMVEEAEARSFALFEVPYELPFIALTERAFGRLVNEQYEVLRRSIAAQERLQRIVLTERGLQAVAAALAAFIGGAVLVLDGRGEELARHTFRRSLPDDVAAEIAIDLRERGAAADRGGLVPRHPELAPRALALPVSPGEGGEADAPARAWLVAVKDAGGLNDFDRLLLQQGVTAVAFELLRLRIADTTARRLAGDVLSALARGELAGGELQRRLEPFGLGRHVAALVLQPSGARGAVERAEAALRNALRHEGIDGLVAVHGGLACALLPAAGDDEVFARAERLHARAARELGASVAGGASRAVPAGQARKAFHEARCAVEAQRLGAVSRRNGGTVAPGFLATYRDLGSFALLLSLQDSDALRLYCESLLSPIEADEGYYGDELVRSLEAFIECNGQWEAAARRLPCHRHTLRYRMRKIEELTGRDLSSARDRIEFWLALRGRELITTPDEESQLR
jgi:PucR family transcriptional regulator, purine catabolism regulatory protein